MVTLLPLFSTRYQAPPANVYRQYAVTFDDADALDSLRTVLDALIISELRDIVTPFSELELFAIDALIPYEPCNMVMTTAQWSMVFAFFGFVAIQQEKQTDCLLPGKTKITFYKHLMRLIRTERMLISFTF